MQLPEEFVQRIHDVYGDTGRQWIGDLPSLLEQVAERWQLEIGAPFGLSYNYVAPAKRADGSDLVVKLGPPSRDFNRELEAMRFYNGNGIAQLLDSDAKQGVMLLERLLPGVMLDSVREVDDDRATLISAEVMRKLWRELPAEHPFPTTADWGGELANLRRHFGGGVGPMPARMVEMAERLFSELEASAAPAVLLHGDLHHENIMTAQREPWLALDPKGVAGEPAYEVGALYRNHPHYVQNRAELKRVQERRTAILSEALQIDRERLLAWGVAQGVLAGWWMIEDHGDGWQDSFVCAEVLAELMR